MNNQRTTSIFPLILSIFFSLAICFAIPCIANATTYYLDAVNGDDSNPGTADEPWKTLNKAYNVATYGDTTYLRSGDYGNCIWSPHDSPPYTGDPNEPLPENTDFITFKAEDGHEPYFTKIDMSYWDPDHTFYTPYIFDGITTRWVRLAHCVGVRLKNMTVYGTSHTTGDGAIILSQTGSQRNNDIVIENCDIHTYLRGIFTYGNNIIIRGCNIHNIGEDSVRLNSGNNILIENCYIYDNNRPNEGEHPDAISMCNVSDVIIRKNIICDQDSQGIYFYGNCTVQDVLVENNLLYDIWSSSIQTCNSTNLVIRHNTVVSNFDPNSAKQVQYGIYNGDDNISSYNNLFIAFYKEIDVSWLNHGYNIAVYHLDNPIEPTSYFYNSMDAAQAELSSLFTAPDSNNYLLKAESKAIDFGTTAWGYPATDILGNPRDTQPDAGCYEYIPAFPPCWNSLTQCHGDTNGDGHVDTLDWPIFRDSFGKNYWDHWNDGAGPYNPCADFNRDGQIDTEDWPALRDNWGKSVPEDCTLGGIWPPEQL